MTEPLLARLPGPDALERRCVALAMLDALLSPEWESRTYSFNRRWSPETGSRMASMRNGEGDEWFILFLGDGSAAIKGLAHEAFRPKRPRGTAPGGPFEGMPETFREFLDEPAFGVELATFGAWYADRGAVDRTG